MDRKTELIVLVPMIIVAITLVVALFWPKAGPAFVFNPVYTAEEVNFEANENSNYDLSIKSDTITSFSISGVIKGEGHAKVYLIDASNQKLLVFSGAAMQKMSGITGFSAAARTDTEYFYNSCEDTCYFTGGSAGPYSLSVELEPNTSIIIHRITYK